MVQVIGAETCKFWELMGVDQKMDFSQSKIDFSNKKSILARTGQDMLGPANFCYALEGYAKACSDLLLLLGLAKTCWDLLVPIGTC